MPTYPPAAAPRQQVPVVVVRRRLHRLRRRPVLENISFTVQPRRDARHPRPRRHRQIRPAEAGEWAASARLRFHQRVRGRHRPACASATSSSSASASAWSSRSPPSSTRMNVEDNVAYRLNEEGDAQAESHTKVRRGLKFVALPTAAEPSSPPNSPEACVAVSRSPAPSSPPGPHPLRLPDRRPGPHHLDHHRRTRRQAERRLPHHLAAHHPSPAGRLYPRHPLLQPERTTHGTRSRTKRHRSTPPRSSS